MHAGKGDRRPAQTHAHQPDSCIAQHVARADGGTVRSPWGRWGSLHGSGSCLRMGWRSRRSHESGPDQNRAPRPPPIRAYRCKPGKDTIHVRRTSNRCNEREKGTYGTLQSVTQKTEALMQSTRSERGYVSQFSDLLQFLSHQKIFYKTCMRAVKVVLNFRVILRMWPGPCTNVSDRPSSGNPRGLAVHVCRILCGACAHPQAPPRMHGSAVL